MPRIRFELASCPDCGEIADVYTAGPRGYGQVFERCRNPRCLLSIEHLCRPDPSVAPPKDLAYSHTAEWLREWRDQQRERRRAKGIPARQIEREVPVPGIDLSFIGI